MIDYMVVELTYHDWMIFKTREEAEAYIQVGLRNYPEERRRDYRLFERKRLD